MKYFVVSLFLFVSSAFALTPDSPFCKAGESVEVDIGIGTPVYLTYVGAEGTAMTLNEVLEVFVLVDLECEKLKRGRVKAALVLQAGEKLVITDSDCTGGPLTRKGQVLKSI